MMTLAALVLIVGLARGAEPQPEDFALWLEQVGPGEVLVVGDSP